jgi:hypothetical protein
MPFDQHLQRMLDILSLPEEQRDLSWAEFRCKTQEELNEIVRRHIKFWSAVFNALSSEDVKKQFLNSQLPEDQIVRDLSIMCRSKEARARLEVLKESLPEKTIYFGPLAGAMAQIHLLTAAPSEIIAFLPHEAGNVLDYITDSDLESEVRSMTSNRPTDTDVIIGPSEERSDWPLVAAVGNWTPSDQQLLAVKQYLNATTDLTAETYKDKWQVFYVLLCKKTISFRRL